MVKKGYSGLHEVTGGYTGFVMWWTAACLSAPRNIS